MKKKKGGALALPSADDNELFIRDIEASAQKVLRKANKLQCSAILAEARKPPKVLVSGGGQGGNRKSASCSPTRRGGSSSKVTAVLDKQQLGIGGATSSIGSLNVDSVGSGDGNCKYDNYTSTHNSPQRVRRSFNNCDIDRTVRKYTSHGLTTATTTSTITATSSASAQITQNATPGIHYSKVNQYSSNVEYPKTIAARLSYSSSAKPRSLPVNNKLGKRISAHSPKRKVKMSGQERERRKCRPTSWSIDDLRMKYRSDEILRDGEDGNSCPMVQVKKTEDIFVAEGVPVAPVITSTPASNIVHPLLKVLRQQLDIEISRSLLHAAAKSRKKRFSLDVHQVWVSNLSHLKEFKETHVNPKRTLYSECQDSQVRKVALPLRNRRDTEAILAENSQIPSVNLQRAFDKAIRGYPAPWKISEDAWLSKDGINHLLLQSTQQEEQQNEEGTSQTKCRTNNSYEVDLVGPFICLQRAHIYRIMSSSHNISKENSCSIIESYPNVCLIQLDRRCIKSVANGREIVEAIWIIRWRRLSEKGNRSRENGTHHYYHYGVHISESDAKKWAFNALETENIVKGHEQLCSGVFKLRQLDVSGEVTNHIYCFVRFGLKRASTSNGLRDILSIVAYPLTGNMKSIGPQKTIISVGDLLGNMGLASPVHTLFGDVCGDDKYLEHLKNLLICNGFKILALGPMEMGEEDETKMKLLVMSQGQYTDDGVLLLPLPPSPHPDLSVLQLLHVKTIACAILCLVELKEDHKEGIRLEPKMTEKQMDNTNSKQIFQRLCPSETSRWEAERLLLRTGGDDGPIYQSEEEEKKTQAQLKENVGGRHVKDTCTEVICSGIKLANTTENKILADPSSHPIFADFFCNNTRSSTNSMMVHLTVATPEVPVTMDSVTVMENEMLVPTMLPHDPRPDSRPLVMNPMSRQELLQLSSQSEVVKVYNLVEGFAPSVMVLNCLSQIEDYTFQGLVEERDAFKSGVHHRRGSKGAPFGPFIRSVENNTSPCCIQSLAPCDKFDTLSYGVTHQAAIGNATRVKGRCIFHSNQRCIEQFSRTRTAKDYAYVGKTRLMVGIGDASCHYVTLCHHQIRGIFRISRKSYELDQKKAEEKRKKQEKEAALDAMAISGKAKMELNRVKMEATARLLVNKRRQEALEGDPLVAVRMRKWQERLVGSELLEVWMDWEMHQDIEGSIFYRCLDPRSQLQFSWDAPQDWGEGGNQEERKDDDNNASSTNTRDIGSSCCPSNPDGDYSEIIKPPTNNVTKDSLSNSNETIISELVENDRLIEGIAKRLGIVPNQAAARNGGSAAASSSSGMSDNNNIKDNHDGAQWKNVHLRNSENDEQDLISDSGDEVGQDEDMPPDGLPQNYRDAISCRYIGDGMEIEGKNERRVVIQSIGHQRLGLTHHDDYSLQRLALSSGQGTITGKNEEGTHIHGIEWRKLGSDHAPNGLLQKVANPQAVAAVSSDLITTTTLRSRIIGKVDLKFVTKIDSSIPGPTKPLLISDILKENTRIFGQSNMQSPEMVEPVNDGTVTVVSDMLELGSQDLDLTSVEKERYRKRDMETKQVIATEELQRKAIVACTTGNIESLGMALDEGNLSVETSDSQGNALLLVATQQGNKRLIKMLLRRGAKLNAQNGDGYSVLHFCFQHGRHKLAEYLKSKGADDTLVNSEGITCYEAGLTDHDIETF